MTLVVMAAGMGSRFGGLKQIEPINDNGEFIIDYSVYDGIIAGFDKVVFIIKEENYNIFKETIGKRIEDKIKVEYVFQKVADIPSKYSNIQREKPWGTGQAILCCKNVVQDNFMVLNADDFYGREAFSVMSEFLNTNCNEFTYALVSYKVCNTLGENGSVKRGICEINNDNLVSVIESKVERIEDKIIASPLNGEDSFEICEDTPVSMNLFGFSPNIFKYLEEKFDSFLNENKKDYSCCEFLIPQVINDLINEEKINLTVLKASAKWLGMTYKEDKENVKREIKNLIESGKYPKRLWK